MTLRRRLRTRDAITAICRLNEPFGIRDAVDIVRDHGLGASHSAVEVLLRSLRSEGALDVISPEGQKPIVLWWCDEEIPQTVPQSWSFGRVLSPTVYYGAAADGSIKIGFSGDARRRASRLRLRLLATEPGGRSVEAARHRQFRQFNIQGSTSLADRSCLKHIRSLAVAVPDRREIPA